MSSLQRYKKAGGFFQLVSLIETFGPQKREKFLEMIELESRPWCYALREKMLTVERVFAWPDDLVMQVLAHLPVKSMAYALLSLKADHRARLESLLQVPERRRVTEAMEENKPTPDEISSVLVKMIEVARRMLSAKEIQPADESLLIQEGIEQLIDQRNGPWSSGSARPRPAAVAPHQAAATARASVPAPAAAAVVPTPATPALHAVTPPNALASPANASAAEVEHLRRTLGATLKENQSLKEEVRALREKLDQIRRIA